mgnify:CR=1 FL=1
MGILAEALLAPVDIVVDSKEASKQKEIVEELRRRGLKIAVHNLNVGDYYLLASEDKKPIIVERKTIIDFANSIRDNRIWEQVKLLKSVEESEDIIAILIIEGSFSLLKRFTKWNLTAVLRVMDEIITTWNLRILPSPNKDATVSWLAAKAKSLGTSARKRIARLRVEKKPMTLNERILYVAEGLVGPTIARKLLRHFKTLRSIANASVAELMKVEGVGEKRAREIYAIFNTPWSEPKT